ncbi:hypothetical protein BD779DRAFT_1682335 [Infundibulicybe gibba]|nr:hypothetical protein BD779DRAFT_1682335 [Infundibulicybe gibba]
MRSCTSPPGDAEDSADDNSPPRRKRIQSQRQRDATKNATEERTKKANKRARAAERAKTQAQNRAAATTVQQASDNDEIQRLRDEAQAERNAAEQELSTVQAQLESHDAPTSNTNQGSIPRPSRIDSVSIEVLRRYMDLEGSEHDIEWARIRSVVRDFLRAGRIEWTLRWKDQSTRRLAKIYDAIEDQLPALRRFRGSWATEYLTKGTFNNHKTYETCKNDGSKYRGKMKQAYRKAAALRANGVLARALLRMMTWIRGWK